MSLLHDALKKVERQRQLGKAPTLDSPRFQRRRRRWPWILVLLVVLGLAFAWTWRAPLMNKARTSLAWVRGTDVVQTQDGHTSADGKNTEPRANTVGERPDSAPTPAAARNVQGPENAANRDQVNPQAAATPSEKGAAANARKNSATAPPVPTAESAPPNPGKSTQGQAPGTKPAPPDRIAGGPLPAKDPPMYWQLPYSERKDLPDFDISMHVYTEDPADRFVILNGVRQVQGDTLPSGQKLIAINPDSITLEDNGHKFRVPRQGGGQ